MMARNARLPVVLGAMLVAWCAAGATGAAEPSGLGLPVTAEPDAVTLQLQCQGDAMEGTFRANQARIVKAETWGATPQSQADEKGYSGRPGGKGRAKPRAKQAAKLPAGAILTVLVTLKPAGDAVLEVDTEAGKAAIRLAEVEAGVARKYLNGALAARRLPAATTLAVSPTDNDYPAATRGPDGTVWVAYVAYQSGGNPDMDAAAKGDFRSLVSTGNGDQIRLVKFDGRQWSAPLAVTEPLLDLWKPTIAVDGAGKVWIAWSQRVDGNWDVYRRSYSPADGRWSKTERLTSAPGADVNVVSTADAAGRVWWAWQGRREKFFQIFLLAGQGNARPVAVTESAANHWTPAIAADSKGSVYVAWDGYDRGNYDVFLRRFQGGKAEPVVAIAATSDYEARPSLAVDGQDRVWVAYEQGGANWGKDYGRMAPLSAGFPADPSKNIYNAGTGREGDGGDRQGLPLYKARRVMVKCYAAGQVHAPAADPATAWDELPRPKSFARLAVAADQRVWLLFRHHPLPSGGRETWAEYAMSYSGGAWSTPQMLPNSDNLLDNRPTAIPFGGDAVLAVYSSDWRLRGASNLVADARLPLKNDLYAALLRGASPASAPKLAMAGAQPPVVQPVHPRETEDIRRLRELRVSLGGKTYQLARGEFHRHTEYTAHRDVDGALEDMWRYAQDAADMDWLGNGDHDNGFGRQYAWWTIQKTTDIYHNPPWFVAPFTYERSQGYPNGHRNVVFATRGIRTLPRGDMRGDEQTGTPDTKMLYAYLKHFGGVCASHTSATGMGTDWRDNDRLVEPVVEIYQGDRNNYECEGAPRGFTAEQIADPNPVLHEKVFPKGLVWNALAKGYRLGFESSSDHISTHTSYAMMLVEKPGREGLMEAFRARRCFAATDNIALIVKCGGHLMGEEFTFSGQPTLEIQALGTAPIVKLDIVCNNAYVYSATPNAARVEMRWTDAAPPKREVNYYYVRIQQADTNLAWSSPVWIHPAAK